MLLIGIRCLIGYAYNFTSQGEAFVCHDLVCFKKGSAISYRTAKGRVLNVYACEQHPPPNFTKNYGLDKPSLTSFLFALGTIVVPILIYRQCATSKSRGEIGSTHEPSGGLVEKFDEAAEKASSSIAVLLRRWFVNILCFAILIGPILLVADQKLPRIAEITLSLVAFGICAVCFVLASRMESEYPEEAELHDEANSLTFKLFVKRTVNWGWFIYGISGIIGIIDCFSKK